MVVRHGQLYKVNFHAFRAEALWTVISPFLFANVRHFLEYSWHSICHSDFYTNL